MVCKSKMDRIDDIWGGLGHELQDLKVMGSNPTSARMLSLYKIFILITWPYPGVNGGAVLYLLYKLYMSFRHSPSVTIG